MVDSIKWWFSFRYNANFWDWVRDTYSIGELKRLAVEATDASLINPYDPLRDATWNQKQNEDVLQRKTVSRLMKRYGDEIWSICLGSGGYSPESGRTGLVCLTKLKMAAQVYNQATFEECLLRNALQQVAVQILQKADQIVGMRETLK